MFPPIEDSVLKSNPKFAAIHATLTNDLLNSDGSTRNHSNLKEYQAATEELKTLRTRKIQQSLISQSLLNLNPTPGPPSSKSTKNIPLPDELLELIAILSLKLSYKKLPLSVLKTLESSPTLSQFPSYASKIAEMISKHLHNECITLVRLTNPTSNPSFLHRSIPKLSPTIQDLQQNIAVKKEILEKKRVRSVNEACYVIAQYRNAMEITIRILEQNKHGQTSRGARAKAELVALKAQQEALTTQNMAVKAEAMVYDFDTKEALRNYMVHLKDAKSRLKQRKRDVEMVLRGYGVGRAGEREGDNGRKEVVMKEIARVFEGVGREVEEVRRDLTRLEGR